jgi:hypothetical protein
MTKQTFWKGLFMLVISIVVTALSATPINVAMLVITAVAAVLPYVGKNIFVFFDSTSPPVGFNWINVASGVLIAVGTGLTDYLGQILIEGVVVWPMLWKVVLTVTLTYIVTTFFAPPKIESPKLFAK